MDQNISQKNWYDKSYKWILIIPALMLLISFIYLGNFYYKTGDFIHKDVSLTGGTTISVFDGSVNIDEAREVLENQFPDIAFRYISDIRTGKTAGFTLETQTNVDEIKKGVEDYLGYKLTSENSSIEFSGSSLSAGFYNQLRNAIIAAFLLMSWVVFFIFSKSRIIKGLATMITFAGLKIVLPSIGLISVVSIIAIFSGLILCLMDKQRVKKDNVTILTTFVLALIVYFLYHPLWLIIPIGIILIAMYTFNSLPSIAVILAAFADIVMTIAVVDMLGMSISGAGIIALLMLIGYSVDTDILLTTRLLKSQGESVNKRIFGAFKTGMTMTLTAIAAIGVSFIIIYSFSSTLKQIFGIILIGLGFDIINTWVTNASILKWYMEVKKLE